MAGTQGSYHNIVVSFSYINPGSIFSELGRYSHTVFHNIQNFIPLVYVPVSGRLPDGTIVHRQHLRFCPGSFEWICLEFISHRSIYFYLVGIRSLET